MSAPAAEPPVVVNMQARVLHDVWLEATARYWVCRASRFEAARPRRGDFMGRATPAQLAQAHVRLTEAAAACRARAVFLDATGQELLDTLTAVGAGGGL